MRILSSISSLFDLLTDLGARLSAVLLGIVVMFFWIEVVSRHFFNAPTGWTAPLSLYFLLIMVMLMLPYLSREGFHVAMSFIYERAPASLRVPIVIVIAGLSSVVCLVSGAMCLSETHRQYVQGVMTMDRFIFPLWWVSSFMVFGFFGAAFHFSRQALTGTAPPHREG